VWRYAATMPAVAGAAIHVAHIGGDAVDSQGRPIPNASAMDSAPTHYFGAASAVQIEASADGNDADAPPGPYLTPGSQAPWVYRVANAGNAALSNVVVIDDAGTPDNTADDFSPTPVPVPAVARGTLESTFPNLSVSRFALHPT